MMRVIPRDLFNDANLLKCLGALWIKLDNLNCHDAKLEENGAPFDIQMSEMDGSTECVNVVFTRRGECFRLYHPMNSRDSWPLYLDDGHDNSIPVFTDDGELDLEFLAFIGAR